MAPQSERQMEESLDRHILDAIKPDEVTTHHHNQALERLLAERLADLSPIHSEMDAMSSARPRHR
jgi:hypothetical protein